MNKELSTSYADMLIQNGIAQLVYKPVDELDIAVAKVMVEDRIKFKESIAYPTLFDVRGVKSISKEARDYLANEGNDLVISSALLINSPVLRMMGNFFITVNKPVRPTQLFTSEDKAIKWLEKFKEPELH